MLKMCRSKKRCEGYGDGKKSFVFKRNLKECIFSELGMEVPQSDRDIDDEPFLYFGYGVAAYFDLTVGLLQMFLVISVCCLPVLWIYSKGKDFESSDSLTMNLSQYVLGNLGGSTVMCHVT